MYCQNWNDKITALEDKFIQGKSKWCEEVIHELN